MLLAVPLPLFLLALLLLLLEACACSRSDCISRMSTGMEVGGVSPVSVATTEMLPAGKNTDKTDHAVH